MLEEGVLMWHARGRVLMWHAGGRGVNVACWGKGCLAAWITQLVLDSMILTDYVKWRWEHYLPIVSAKYTNGIWNQKYVTQPL